MGAELWTGFKLGDRWVRPEVNKIDDTRIDAKAMEVLVALAELSPAVVSGSALLDRVWPDVVVVNNVVYQAIAQLRKALGDAARAPRYIECVPRRGYRLIADIAVGVDLSRSSADIPHNLPQDLTSFIGRERELAELAELASHRRLITLTGVGGCGKTRLALAVARACMPNFPDGVWLVDLAPVTDATQVVRAIAKALHIQDSKDRSIHDSVVESLIHSRSLLVLDNCEHVVDACARFAEKLLREGTDLRILATSREGFGIGVEQPWPVQPLAIPRGDDGSSITELATIESVRLFVERANVVQRNFALTEENAETATEICRRLDGLPFAIELAAARMRDMSAEQIKLKLRDRFRLLAAGSRTALPRQRTLQATLDWSHQLLLEPERKLLRRLAVFAGDFAAEAAAALAETVDESEHTFEVLTRLVDQSMLQVDPATGRYRMLETVRQYADDRLAESGESSLIRDRHRDHYVSLADGLSHDIEAGNWQSDVFQRFVADQDNFEGALAWCHETNFELELRLARQLSWFWLRLNTSSALHWFEDLLAKAPASFPERSELLRLAAMLHIHGDPGRATQYLEEAVQAARATGGSAWSEAAASNILAHVLMIRGEVDKSDALLKRAALAAERTDPRVRALLLMESVETMMWIRFDDAQKVLKESELVLRGVRDLEGLCRTLSTASLLSMFKGDLVRARATLTEAVELSRTIGNQRLASLNMLMLGTLAEVAGDNVEAAQLLERCEKSFARMDIERHIVRTHLGRQLWKIGQRERGVEMLRDVLRAARPNVAHLHGRLANTCGIVALHGTANIACDLGEHTRSARLYGAARKMREAVVLRLPQDLLDRLFDGVADVLRASLGERAYEAESAVGASMTYQQAVDFALSETSSPQDGSLATVHQLPRARGSARGAHRPEPSKANKNRDG